MSVTSGTKRKEGGVGETVRVIIHALIIALVIRTFLFQPFNIPSGSMKATLLVGLAVRGLLTHGQQPTDVNRARPPAPGCQALCTAGWT